MLALKAVVLCTVVSVSTPVEELVFPTGFKFGAASAAYQVEGAWNVSDKGESIWDQFTHTNTNLLNGSNGDVACDSYRLYKEDVKMASELGLHFYRFSISWPRLLPTGFPDVISKDGKRYYSNLIDEFLKAGIEPIVTLYHWDLPLNLQELGGWANPSISEWFADYARVVYSLYGDRVKTWITINEPIIICDPTFNIGVLAPLNFLDRGGHMCAKHTLLAHAKAWRIYDQEYKPKYKGRVSIANQLLWLEPLTPADEELTELAREYCVGRFSHPIYSKTGGWPPTLEKTLKRANGSILAALTREEIDLIKGTYDFYGLNHYTSRMVRAARSGEPVGSARPSWPQWGSRELGLVLEGHVDWKYATANWFLINPEGLRRQIVWLKKRYGDINILITENGFAGNADDFDDRDRIQYLGDNLKQVLLVIKEDSVNVIGYTAWSLMDNFEWMDGYKVAFGLYAVNFSDPARRRTPRSSARYYARIIQAHSLQEPYTFLRDEL